MSKNDAAVALTGVVLVVASAGAAYYFFHRSRAPREWLGNRDEFETAMKESEDLYKRRLVDGVKPNPQLHAEWLMLELATTRPEFDRQPAAVGGYSALHHTRFILASIDRMGENTSMRKSQCPLVSAYRQAPVDLATLPPSVIITRLRTLITPPTACFCTWQFLNVGPPSWRFGFLFTPRAHFLTSTATVKRWSN
jgi:hypothetical protein